MQVAFYPFVNPTNHSLFRQIVGALTAIGRDATPLRLAKPLIRAEELPK